MGAACPALADNDASEELTYGPAKLNSGYYYLANDLSGEVDLVPFRWSLLGTYLLATDAFEALHNPFELGPIWHPTARLELGAYLLYSPFATGTAHAEIKGGVGAGTIVTDRISSDSYGGAVSANYQLGDERWTLTFTGEVAYTYYDINQNVTAPTLTTPQILDGELQQAALTAGIGGRYHWTRLSLQGSYFFYDKDPAEIGEVSLPGHAANSFVVGSLATDASASGLPSAPLAWTAGATFRQQIGQHLAVYVSYGFLEYVSPDGAGQVVTPKVAWQFNGTWRVYAAYTFQANSQALFPSGQDEPPQQLQLFTVGVNMSL